MGDFKNSLVDVPKLKDYLISLYEKGIIINRGIVYLKDLNIDLKNFEEFKNVSKVNILPAPVYHVQEKTGIPLFLIDKYFGFIPSNIECIQERKFDDSISERLKSEIDVLSFQVSELWSRISIDELECGVWLQPNYYNPENFQPERVIVVKYQPQQIADVKGLSGEALNEEIKRLVLPEVERLLFESKSNVKPTYLITCRFSERSFKKN